MCPKKLVISFAAVVFAVLAGLTGRAQQQTPPAVNLTIHLIGLGSPAITGAVAVIPQGRICSNADGTSQCTYQFAAGTVMKLTSNAPTPSTPGVFSLGTGDASGCATSTCTFTINQDSEVTTTFDPGAPVFTLSIALNPAAAPGEIGADSDRCQNYDAHPSQLPAQFSDCTTSYAPNSLVTLQAAPPAGTRFSGFSQGTNNAAACATGSICSFALNGNTSIAASFGALTALAVDPPSSSIDIGQSQSFTARGTYDDGTAGEAIAVGQLGTWITRTSMGQARFDFAAAAAGGRIFAIGGIDGSGPEANLLGSVEAYDPSANAWTARASISARASLAAGAIDDRYIYAVGGDVSGGCPVDTLEMYDAIADAWTPKSPMPGGSRRFLASAVVGRTLYAIGGELNTCGQPSGTALNRLEAYNPDTDQWTSLAPMPTARRFFGAGVVHGIIYAVGGDDEHNNLAVVEAYDPAANTWSTKAPMPDARSLLAVTVIDDVLYAIGGNNNGYANTVSAYDSAADRWSNKAFIPTVQDLPRRPDGELTIISGQRAELAAAPLDGRLYAMGGLLAPGAGPATAYVSSFADGLIWSSSQPDVAAVQQDNPTPVRGLTAGTTSISARGGVVTCAPNGCGTLTVTVPANTPPTVTIFGPSAISINAGQSFSANGSFRDPDSGQTWTATVDYGDGSGVNPLALGAGSPPLGPTGTFSLSHSYPNAGHYTVTVTVIDSANGSGLATVSITVNQPAQQIFLGLPNSLTTQTNSNGTWGCGSFFDSTPGGGPWSGTIDYGDGSGVQPLVLAVPPGGNPCASGGGQPPTGAFSFDHSYSSTGTFTVSLTVQNITTHASKSGSFSVTVNANQQECVEVVAALTAGPSVPPSLVLQMAVIDRSSGQTVFTAPVPIGTTDFGSAPAGSYRFQLTAPAGYVVTPASIDVDAACGHNVALALSVAAIDTTPPVVTVPANIITQATSANGVIVSFTATALDAVDGPLPATCVPPSGSLFPVGTTTVSCTAVDHAGNVSQPKTFTVLVAPKNAKPPKVTAPKNMRVEATGPSGAVVTFVATATDPVDGTLPTTCAPASGSTFPIGVTTVTCSATNRFGKSDTDAFTIAVRDTTPPTIVSVTPSVTLLPDTDQMVPVSIAVVATDAVDAAPVCRITRVAGQGKDLNNDGVIDWTITGNLSLNIEATARKHKDRTYTITIKCTDAWDNTSAEKTAIVVSHAF